MCASCLSLGNLWGFIPEVGWSFTPEALPSPPPFFSSGKYLPTCTIRYRRLNESYLSSRERTFFSYLRPMWSRGICGQRDENDRGPQHWSFWSHVINEIKSHNSSASTGEVYRCKEEQNKNNNERKRWKNIIISTSLVSCPFSANIQWVTRL